MKILQTTTVILSVLFLLGTAQEGNTAVIQPIGPSSQQDHIILTHGGGGHGHGGGGHWHGGGGHGHGGGGHWHGGFSIGGIGLYYGPGIYYAPPIQRVCNWNPYSGRYYCQYYY